MPVIQNTVSTPLCGRHAIERASRDGLRGSSGKHGRHLHGSRVIWKQHSRCWGTAAKAQQRDSTRRWTCLELR